MKKARSKTLAVAVISALTLILSAGAEAKPKEKIFDSPPDKVFQALYEVVRQKYTITFADEKKMVVSFRTGTSAAAWPMVGTASVETAGQDQAKLVIVVQKDSHQLVAWGEGDRVARRIFELVGEGLKKETTH